MDKLTWMQNASDRNQFKKKKPQGKYKELNPITRSRRRGGLDQWKGEKEASDVPVIQSRGVVSICL